MVFGLLKFYYIFVIIFLVLGFELKGHLIISLMPLGQKAIL